LRGRGTEKAHSDIDLMVVGTISLRQLGKLLSGLGAELGREVNPHILTAEEFARRKKAGDHFPTAVLAEPKVFVILSDPFRVGARFGLCVPWVPPTAILSDPFRVVILPRHRILLPSRRHAVDDCDPDKAQNEYSDPLLRHVQQVSAQRKPDNEYDVTGDVNPE
jgi:hypothetical protein